MITKSCKDCGAELADRRKTRCDACYTLVYYHLRRAYDKVYRDKHQKQEAVRKATWYKKNKERILAHQKEYLRRKKLSPEAS